MRNDLIRAVLDCGIDDLSLLDNSEADVFEIVQHMKDDGKEISMNGVIGEIFREGIFRLEKEVKARREWLEKAKVAGELLSEYEHEELEAIRDLEPENDFSYYLNLIDTHLNCDSGKKEVYETWFEQELQELMDYTGFDIEG